MGWFDWEVRIRIYLETEILLPVKDLSKFGLRNLNELSRGMCSHRGVLATLSIFLTPWASMETWSMACRSWGRTLHATISGLSS